MDADKLKGLAVVSLAEGARLGRITDLLFETAPLRVAALRARGDGGDFVLPFARVRNVGTDAVTVESSQETQIASAGTAFDGLVGLGQREQLKVVAAAGTLLGTVRTVELDPATGRVTRLVAHQGGVLGLGGTSTPVEVAAIRSFGTDVLTVGTGSSAAPEA